MNFGQGDWERRRGETTPIPKSLVSLACLLVCLSHWLVNAEALNFSGLLALAKFEIRVNFVVNHSHDGLKNLIVAGATAQISGHPFFDLILGGFGVLVEQRFGGHDLSRRADPALEPAVFNKGLL